jgi:hypothetical protein
MARSRGGRQSQRFPVRARTTGVDARVTALHPLANSEGGAADQRDPVRRRSARAPLRNDEQQSPSKRSKLHYTSKRRAGAPACTTEARVGTGRLFYPQK